MCAHTGPCSEFVVFESLFLLCVSEIWVMKFTRFQCQFFCVKRCTWTHKYTCSCELTHVLPVRLLSLSSSVSVAGLNLKSVPQPSDGF